MDGTPWILRRQCPQREQGTWSALRARAMEATNDSERPDMFSFAFSNVSMAQAFAECGECMQISKEVSGGMS